MRLDFCISYVYGSKTTNTHILTDHPQKMDSLSSRPWMCLRCESPFCPVTMTHNDSCGYFVGRVFNFFEGFFFFPSDGLSLNKITSDVERTILCEHCDSVFTFPSHGFTQLHLDSCTMCVVMAGVFSLMWLLLFHGPSPVYSSLYGHCDCFQLFARTKKIAKWYSCAWNSDTSTRILVEMHQRRKWFRTQAKALTISTVRLSSILPILCCWVQT